MGKRHEKVVGQRPGRAYALEGDGYRLGLGGADDYRYAARPTVFGKDKGVGARLQLAIRQAKYVEADSIFHGWLIFYSHR